MEQSMTGFKPAFRTPLQMAFSMLVIGLAFPVHAEGVDSGNAAWVLTSTALVLFMTLPGLALFYGGLVRTKNVLSVLMQCFGIACVITLLWVAGMYSLAFSPGGPWIGGLSKAMFAGITEASLNGTVPETVFAMYQLTFAIITP